MTQDSVIRARLDAEIKEQATAVIKEYGMTPSMLIRRLMTRIAQEKEIPFEPFVPNAETIEAMEDVRAGRNMSGPYDSIEELMEALNAED